MTTLWMYLHSHPDAPLHLHWEAASRQFVVHVGPDVFTTSAEETAQLVAAVPSSRDLSPAEQQRAWLAALWALSYCAAHDLLPGAEGAAK